MSKYEVITIDYEGDYIEKDGSRYDIEDAVETLNKLDGNVIMPREISSDNAKDIATTINAFFKKDGNEFANAMNVDYIYSMIIELVEVK